MNPTKQQTAIYDWIRDGSGHGFFRARAGCGKSTTVRGSVALVPRSKKVFLTSFDTTTSGELAERVKLPNVLAATTHSIAFSALKKHVGAVELSKTKVRDELEFRNKNLGHETIRAVEKLTSLAKSFLIEPEELSRLAALFEDYGVTSSEEVDPEEVVSLTADMLRFSLEVQDVVDFDDMIWIPAKCDYRPETRDFVFCDESQDWSPAQIAFGLKLVVKGGRFIAVGDDRQCIYTFRGADSDATVRLIEKTRATVFPLSYTFRCAKKVVKEAQRFVPDIQALPKAPEGKVTTIDIDQIVDQAAPGDFVISRTNQPLVTQCIRFIRAGKRCHIAGHAFGTMLGAFVRARKAKSVEDLTTKVTQWRDMKCLEKTYESDERGAREAIDKANCVLEVCRFADSPRDVEERIQTLFTDEGEDGIILTTCHKAKGREADRVFVLKNTFHPDENREEENMAYVAVTRAKTELVYVEDN